MTMNRARVCWILLIVLFTCVSAGCRSGGGAAARSVTGQVVDPQNNAVAGVAVRVPGRSAIFTGADGNFTIRNAPAAERLAVSFSAANYIETTSIYDTRAKSRGNTVIIWPRAAAVSLDATKGGRVSFPGGSVTFPPNALVDARGRAIDGNVLVSMTALDVTDRRQLRSAPGDFTARMQDNSIQRLETFGVFEVFVEDVQRQRANLARGQTASIELQIPPASRRRTPREVGLFSFDRNSGRWLEAGTLTAIPELQVLSAQLPDLYVMWNADQVMDTTCIQAEILDCGGAPGILNALVETFGVGYGGHSQGTTDATGFVCLPVKLSATASVIAHHPSVIGVQSNPLEIATPTSVASIADCGNPTLCPLLVKTHLGYGAFSDALNAFDSTLWQQSNGYANSDPNFDVGWRADHISFIPSTDNFMRITLSDQGSSSTACATTPLDCSNHPYASGEYRTSCFYGYGTYKATIKAARGSGLVTTFFTFSEPNHGVPWDEVDVEILGRNPTASECPSSTDTLMQTNYFVNGVGGHEVLVCLSLNVTVAHTYEFKWTANAIDWYVDRTTNPLPVHTETYDGSEPWPRQTGRVMASLWAGSASANTWLGPFAYTTPVFAEYSSIEYTP
jgi:endo-1,3-1,4-beta-glycanase ExoK